MKRAFQRAALPWIVVLALVPASALAENKVPREVLYEITLDIDNDSRTDRTMLVKDPESVYADLLIYLAVGAKKPDLSRKPTVLKKDLTADPILGLESNGKGSLIVKYGRRGSNQYEMSLTIVHRDGEFWVGGYAKEWDTQKGMGSCDINFLTGSGVASRGLARSKPITANFIPIKLEDWSEDKQPKACTP